MEHVAKGEDNAHSEAIVPPIRLGESQFFLHTHRG
jgi:hypothetical protein